MASSWWLHPDYGHALCYEPLRCLAQAAELSGEFVTKSPISQLHKVTLGEDEFYVKCYYQAGKHLRKYVGRSRICAEWRNLQLFARLGIPTPCLVAYGERRQLGYFQLGVLITKALPDCMDLVHLAEQKSMYIANKNWRQQLAEQVADYTRRLHEHHFIHGDLKWRNILVSTATPAEPKIYFIDCPQGRRLMGPLLARGKIKDLACLDKRAKQFLSRSDRLRFYLHYRGIKRLSENDKKQIKKIVMFFKGRE